VASCDFLVYNAHLATMNVGGAAYGAVMDGVVVVQGESIAWVGPTDDAPRALVADPSDALDAGGGWVTPGLIDPHTHLVFGGDRAAEFEMRLLGRSYADIARAGGGILSTVRATRAASSDDLERTSGRRLDHMMAQGLTTIEIKSGYGLDSETELRMLEVARGLERTRPVTVSTTLLAAHAIPPEYEGRREAYLDLVCGEIVPKAAERGLADAVDAFCEGIAFTPAECARVLRAGRAHGLAGRLHADQLSDLGGAAMAAREGARSADHLEYTTEEGVRAMAAAGTVAVLLPGAFHVLGETQRPPVEALRAHGVRIAVATDANPGSSPVLSPLLALHLACTEFGLTPEEALVGMTRHAAPVVGMGHDRGVLEAGRVADLAVWAIGHPAELSYWIGANPCWAVVRHGAPWLRRADPGV